MNKDKTIGMIRQLAEAFAYPMRSPILKTPADYDMKFETVFFPSQDGTPLEAWFIPCEASEKLIIANHPLWFNRYGFPAHLEPWRSIGSAAGNDFEVDFIPDYRILHEAGYNVLAYDMRNSGQSGTANGGSITATFAARDVIGSIQYVKSRADLKQMTIGLFSRCMGANATITAMGLHPEIFKDIRCMVSPQPLSVGVTMERTLELMGIPDSINELDDTIQLLVSSRLEDMSVVGPAKKVCVPTFLYQVYDDLLTRPSDVQSIFDNIPLEDKKLVWIYGTTARWDGYLYFQRAPKEMLDWFAKYMS